MQATWSQPVAEAVVFSNDFARRRERPGAFTRWWPWPRTHRRPTRQDPVGRQCHAEHRPANRLSAKGRS
jgi:hypothetical protein